MVEIPQDTASSGTSSGLKMVMENAQSVLTFVLALGAFLSGGGFVIVHVYLRQYTAIMPESIPPTRYLRAGVGLMVFILVSGLLILLLGYAATWLEKRLKMAERLSPAALSLMRKLHLIRTDATETLTQFPYYAVSYMLLPLIIPAILSRNVTIYNSVMLLLLVFSLFYLFDVTLGRLPAFMRGSGRLGNLLGLFLVLLFYTLLTGWLYGIDLYGRLPHELGGGSRAAVQVVMQDNAYLTALGIELDENQQRSEPLCLLFELNDGLLLYNPRLKNAVVITMQEAMLVAYLDAGSAAACTPPG